MSDGELRSFALMLGHLEDGQILVDLSEKLQQLNLALIKQAEAVGKAKGTLTLTLKFGADDGGTVQIDADIKIKEPQPVRARTVTWMTKAGQLATSNPRQTKLALREVPRQQPARDVDAAPAPRNV